jgi:hypothetical protein
MDHFAGLDVSVKETSICILDDTSRIVREVKAVSEHEALLQVLGTHLPFQADRTGSRAAIAMAFQRLPKQISRRSVSRRGTCGGVAGADQ